MESIFLPVKCLLQSSVYCTISLYFPTSYHLSHVMFLSAQIQSFDNECPLFVIQPKLIPSQWMAVLKVYVCLQDMGFLMKSAACSAACVKIQCGIM